MMNNDISITPHYVAKNKDAWGIEMRGTEAVDGSDLDHAGIFGLEMTNFKIEGAGIKKARIKNKRGKWLEYKEGYTELGDGSTITGFEIVGAGYILAIHLKGGQWMTPVFTSDEEGNVLVGTGAPIDAIWIDTAW